MKREICIAYMPERRIYEPCRNGFPQTGACAGLDVGLPICCNEKACGRLYEQWGGSPPKHMLTPEAA